jgi:hypothetical protein
MIPAGLYLSRGMFSNKGLREHRAGNFRSKSGQAWADGRGHTPKGEGGYGQLEHRLKGRAGEQRERRARNHTRAVGYPSTKKIITFEDK